jgi:hypothetical protein
MANWPTPHLFAWFGTENCYLAMAAMRPDPSRPRDGSGLATTTPLDHAKTILAEAATLRSAVQKNTVVLGQCEAHGEAGVISYRTNIIALPYRAKPLASGNWLIGISKKAPLSAGLE